MDAIELKRLFRYAHIYVCFVCDIHLMHDNRLFRFLIENLIFK